MILFLLKTVDLWILIALQVVRTSFGFHVRECMGSSSPPPVYGLSSDYHHVVLLLEQAGCKKLAFAILHSKLDEPLIRAIELRP